MSDIAVAIGLVLVIEGLLWALAPGFALKMLESASRTPVGEIKIAGWVAVGIGLVVVWLVRG